MFGAPRKRSGSSFVAGRSARWCAVNTSSSAKYIADFAVPSARVIIEVDGAYHATRCAADARRDRALGRRGWRVVRLPSELVVKDLAEAVARVRAALEGR